MNQNVQKTVVIFTLLFAFNNKHQLAKRLPVIGVTDYFQMIVKTIKVQFINSNADWL